MNPETEMLTPRRWRQPSRRAPHVEQGSRGNDLLLDHQGVGDDGGGDSRRLYLGDPAPRSERPRASSWASCWASRSSCSSEPDSTYLDLLVVRRAHQHRRDADHRQPGRQPRRDVAGRRRRSSRLRSRSRSSRGTRVSGRCRSTRSTRRSVRRSTGSQYCSRSRSARPPATCVSEQLNLGYWKAALLFGALIGVVAIAYYALPHQRDRGFLARIHLDPSARCVDR